jgi:hypothetical protein
MNELNEVGFGNNGLPVVSWDVHHGTEQFQHQVGVLATLLDHHSVVFQVLNEGIVAARVELRNVPDAFEQQSVSKFASSSNHFIQLTIAR